MKTELEQVQNLLDQETPNPDEAINLLNPLLEQDQKHWLVYYFLGVAQMKKSAFKKAINYLEESVAVHAENPHAYLMIAKCYFALENFTKAERYGKGAIQLNQSLLDAWICMGDIYWKQSQLDKAIQCFTIANKMDPKDYLIPYKLAELNAEKGDIKKAMQLFDVTLHMKAGFRKARIKKNRLYHGIGKDGKRKEGTFIHLCFNHLYAKSLSDMLGNVNTHYNEQQHQLFVEAHWAIENYKPDFSDADHAVWFNHKYDLQAVITRCLDSDVDGVFVHGLFFSWQKQLIKKINTNKHIGWIIWGGDLYNPLKVKEPIVDIVKYIDSIHSLVDGDIQMFNKHYGERHTFRFGYPYPGLYGEMQEIKETQGRPKIIVGNSGDYSNNHIEILEALRNKNDIGDYEILLPASYNLIPEYEKAIYKWSKVAGMYNQITLIKKFIEPERYKALLNSSEMLITAHNRQQAIGNMLLSLYSGNPTILKRKITVSDEQHINPTWQMLQKYDLGISSFEDFKNAASVNSFIKASKPMIVENQNTIISEFGMEVRINDLVTSCKAILDMNRVNIMVS